jgi:hypothetical protein
MLILWKQFMAEPKEVEIKRENARQFLIDIQLNRRAKSSDVFLANPSSF